MKIGYARVSTHDQRLDAQVQELRNAGCERIFSDQGVSGKAVIKPALREAISFARAGDQIIVHRLDRLCRSLKQLIEEIEALHAGGIEFGSLRENIDTASPSGRLYFHIIGALAEFERELIADRTRAGMQAALARGARIGRKPALDDESWATVKELMDADNPMPVAKIAALVGVKRQTIYARLKREREAALSE